MESNIKWRQVAAGAGCGVIGAGLLYAGIVYGPRVAAPSPAALRGLVSVAGHVPLRSMASWGPTVGFAASGAAETVLGFAKRYVSMAGHLVQGGIDQYGPTMWFAGCWSAALGMSVLTFAMKQGGLFFYHAALMQMKMAVALFTAAGRLAGWAF